MRKIGLLLIAVMMILPAMAQVSFGVVTSVRSEGGKGISPGRFVQSGLYWFGDSGFTQ